MVSHVGEDYFSDIFGEFSVPFFFLNTVLLSFSRAHRLLVCYTAVFRVERCVTTLKTAVYKWCSRLIDCEQSLFFRSSRGSVGARSSCLARVVRRTKKKRETAGRIHHL